MSGRHSEWHRSSSYTGIAAAPGFREPLDIGETLMGGVSEYGICGQPLGWGFVANPCQPNRSTMAVMISSGASSWM